MAALRRHKDAPARGRRMTKDLILPSRLDSSGAPPLALTLTARRGAALRLDASGVEVIGALAFEVIIAAGRQWGIDGQCFATGRLSDRYLESCDALGLRPDAPWLTHGAAEPGQTA